MWIIGILQYSFHENFWRNLPIWVQIGVFLNGALKTIKCVLLKTKLRSELYFFVCVEPAQGNTCCLPGRHLWQRVLLVIWLSPVRPHYNHGLIPLAPALVCQGNVELRLDMNSVLNSVVENVPLEMQYLIVLLLTFPLHFLSYLGSHGNNEERWNWPRFTFFFVAWKVTVALVQCQWWFGGFNLEQQLF